MDESDVPKELTFDQLEDWVPGKWIWGVFRQYCGISLIEKGLILPGKEEFSACFQVKCFGNVDWQGRLYSFYGEEELQTFLHHPWDFVEAKQIPIPPPKVFIFGMSQTRRVITFVQITSVPCCSRSGFSSWNGTHFHFKRN